MSEKWINEAAKELGLQPNDPLVISMAFENIENKLEEEHDHTLWEVEMLRNELLSQGGYIAISKNYFNSLYINPTYKGREPL